MDHAAPNLPVTQPNTSPTSAIQPSLANIGNDPKVLYELNRLDSNIPFSPVRRYLHHTWAQTFYSRPEYYLQPATVPELQKIVTLARRCRRRICVTGYGHSPSDLTCTSSWLINLDKLNKLHEVDVDGKPGLVRFDAGISLHDLNESLATHGYTLPNLGSIDVQSIAGAIATGTHGSSLQHGILSQSIVCLTILLSNSQLVTCSADKNADLFRAALCSLGSLGIIVEMTFQAVPEFNISWKQTLQPLDHIITSWPNTLWKTAEYTRVWWCPYLKRAVIWRAHRVSPDSKTEPIRAPAKTFYGGRLGYYIYHNLLAISNWVPRILPWVEWFVFGMQYGFKPDSFSMSAVEPARLGLKMDCLYSQFVNEWALPLSKGPEAITRLSAWINHEGPEVSGIPYSSKGVWVHCPIEVRVTNADTANNKCGVKPYLDPTCEGEPTLYLNATLYRPYGKDPPCHERYYEAFEYLMRELGAKPHWAKNFAFTGRDEIQAMYGNNMTQFMNVRDEVDPEGMFIGEWHLRNLPINEPLIEGDIVAEKTGKRTSKVKGRKSLVEGEVLRRKMGFGWGDGLMWEGARIMDAYGEVYGEDDDGNEIEFRRFSTNIADEKAKSEVRRTMSVISNVSADAESGSAFETMTDSRASEESFDLMAKGEASVYEGSWREFD